MQHTGRKNNQKSPKVIASDPLSPKAGSRCPPGSWKSFLEACPVTRAAGQRERSNRGVGTNETVHR